MIARNEIKIGARIIEDDPEEAPEVPYKGIVADIKENGKGIYDYYAVVKLDPEAMKQKRISMVCPDGIMYCFPFAISLIPE